MLLKNFWMKKNERNLSTNEFENKIFIPNNLNIKKKFLNNNYLTWIEIENFKSILPLNKFWFGKRVQHNIEVSYRKFILILIDINISNMSCSERHKTQNMPKSNYYLKLKKFLLCILQPKLFSYFKPICN
jgi:hypothetical protein